jgi:ABC-type transport system involved in multi-copper enzyme maturation permease subunit
MLATDLRNREIVLSKLGARVANVTLLVLTGLPILSLMQFLGGVDPTLVLTGFAATFMTVLGIAAVSILNSVLFKRPRDAIAITYLYLICYLGLGLVAYTFQTMPGNPLRRVYDLPIWFGGDPPTVSSLVTWLNSGNIVIAITQIGRAGSSAAPALLSKYALFHAIVTVVFVGWAVFRLRSVALRQTFATVRKPGVWHRLRPPVGDLPMLWKEVSVEGGIRLNWVAAGLVAFLFFLSLVPAADMIIDYLVSQRGWGFDWLAREMNVWVRVVGTMVACLTISSVAVRASTSIGAERDKQTLDSLLTTPMDSTSMLWAKFVGNLLSVRLAWIWLAIIWALGVITGGLSLLALPLIMGGWVVYAAFCTMLGLWFSTTARSTTRATVYTMLTTAGLAFGHWLIWLCCAPLLLAGGGRGGDDSLVFVAKFQFGMTPPLALGMLAFTGEDFAHEWSAREMIEMIGFSLTGVFLYGVAALIFWFALLEPRFRAFTRREDEHYPQRPRSLLRADERGCRSDGDWNGE